jgi:hypothetical protein
MKKTFRVTPEMKQFIFDNDSKMTLMEMKAAVGLSDTGLRYHRRKLGLPHKESATIFKPGYDAPKAPEGSKRTDKTGYTLIKRGGQWKLLQRVVWEDANGPVPKGFVVGFKDGQRSNCHISNLKLMTREEVAQQNTPWQYSEEIREVILMASKLKKAINESIRRQNDTFRTAAKDS